MRRRFRRQNLLKIKNKQQQQQQTQVCNKDETNKEECKFATNNRAQSYKEK